MAHITAVQQPVPQTTAKWPKPAAAMFIVSVSAMLWLGIYQWLS